MQDRAFSLKVVSSPVAIEGRGLLGLVNLKAIKANL